MCTSRKRKCSDDDAKGNEKEESSYAKMKVRFNNVQHELGQSRMELMETQQQKAEIEAAFEIVRKEQLQPNRDKRGSSKGGQSSYAKLKMQFETNQGKMSQVQPDGVAGYTTNEISVRRRIVNSAHGFGGSAHRAASDTTSGG